MLRNGSEAGLSELAGCHARKEEINTKGINKKMFLCRTKLCWEKCSNGLNKRNAEPSEQTDSVSYSVSKEDN